MATTPDPLAVIEGVNAVADLIDAFKAALIARGWSEHMAEMAAITAYQTERAVGARS